MRQQRQAARLALAVADQQVDEPVLEPQPSQERRLFDRLTQRLSCERGEEMETMLGEAAQLGVDAEPAELVAAHGDDDRRRLEGVSGERLAERADRLDGQPVGEELLELIDHEHRRRAASFARPGHRLGRVRTGGEHRGDPTAACDGGDQAGPHERRLAAPRRSRNHEQRRRTEPVEAHVYIVRAAEERLAVGPVVRRKTLVGAGRADDCRCRRRGESRVLAKDRGFEIEQVDARLQPDLGEGSPGAGQRSQGIGLPGAAVLRQREQRPTTLAERFLVDQRLGRGGDLAMLAGGETSDEPVLLRRPAQLLEAARLAAPRRPAVEVGERRSPPQRQRPVVGRGSTIRFAARHEHAAAFDEPLELAGIDVGVVESQAIPVGRGLDGVVVKHFAEPADADLDLLAPRLRRIVAPQRVGELLGRHGDPASHRQHTQRDAVTRLERPNTVDPDRS